MVGFIFSFINQLLVPTIVGLFVEGDSSHSSRTRSTCLINIFFLALRSSPLNIFFANFILNNGASLVKQVNVRLCMISVTDGYLYASVDEQTGTDTHTETDRDTETERYEACNITSQHYTHFNKI